MSTQRPFRLGLTGGIASGKSTVMHHLAELGAETIDADVVYHGLICPGQPLYDAIVQHWGVDVVASDGQIDRRALGRIVFSDPAELKALDALTHPAIRVAIDDMYEVSTSAVVAIDAVKLIESGHADRCDSVWLVVAAPETQIARLIHGRKLDREDAERRVAAQPDVEARIARADVVIQNDGSRADLLRQVNAAWDRIRPDSEATGSDATTSS